MIFAVHHLVWYLSQFLVLRPGDVVNTGTPAGVALGSDSVAYLKAGDVVEMEIEGLGRQRQAVGQASMSELTAVRALVTGGTSGIGLAITRAFLAQGAAVAVLGRAPAPPAGLEQMVYVCADITEDSDLRAAVEVAQAVVYLASPAAGSTTGASIAVDGGMAGLRLRR